MSTKPEGLQYDFKNKIWYERHQLSNNQSCQIWFILHTYLKCDEYSVAFAVADKKKQLSGWMEQTKKNNITLKSTGTCGAEALLWCRKKIFEFEDMETRRLNSKYNPRPTKMVVGGEDSRRFRAYERALIKHGYHKTLDSGEWCLIKWLHR